MEKLDVKKMSVQDIVKALEDKSISLEEVDKNILKECVVVMKNWGYRNSEIGNLLKVSDRSVQRYVSDVRESNSLATTADFQKRFMAEAISNFRTQYYRLIRISHSEGVTTFEKTRAIFAACQVLKDVIVIMERLGYVSIENTQKLKAQEEEQIRLTDYLAKRVTEFAPDYKTLTLDQQGEIIERLKKQNDHTDELFVKWISEIAADNRLKGITNELFAKPALPTDAPVVSDNNKMP